MPYGTDRGAAVSDCADRQIVVRPSHLAEMIKIGVMIKSAQMKPTTTPRLI